MSSNQTVDVTAEVRGPVAADIHAADATATTIRGTETALAILLTLSVAHCLNDIVQALLPAIYPMLKSRYALSFGQIGVLTLAFQLTASLLQPLIGLYADKRPKPYALAIGMGFTLIGLVMLSRAGSFGHLLGAAMLVGIGSSIFHPEASRVARLASGGRHGLAQSVFQVGGNAGQALGPLLAAFIVLPLGQGSILDFAVLPLVAMAGLGWVGRWYTRHGSRRAARRTATATPHGLAPGRVAFAITLLIALMVSKNFYLASLSSYYTFYLIQHFGVPVQLAQIYLFVFLGSAAAGTLLGGPIGDRIGQRRVIWVSILGVLPFTLMLPYASLFWTAVLSVAIGFIIASAFPAIVLYAQELLPGRVGTVSGLFFGLSFGLGGIGAAMLGVLADHVGITTVYRLCAVLPAFGVLTVLLPRLPTPRDA